VTINAHTGIFSVSGNKADLYDRTNPDWAPSLKLGPQEEESQSATLSSKKRYERARTRDDQKTKFRTAQALLDLQSSQNEMSDEEVAETGATSKSCKICLERLFGTSTERRRISFSKHDACRTPMPSDR